MSDQTIKTKKDLRQPKRESQADWSTGLSSGCTLLNLACTGRSTVAWLPGYYYMLVGDSQSGKTWLLLQTMAEATINPYYDKYRLILDKPERGALMVLDKYFGKSLPDRLEMPREDRSSRTLEEFYDHVKSATKRNKPFIYGLDSEDALPSEVEIAKSEEDRKARIKAEKRGVEVDISGSYGLSRPKKNSTALREAHNDLEDTGSILFVIKQTRDRIGFGSQFDPKTRSGGNALTFYATLELWFSVGKKIKKTVRGRDMVVGSRLKIHIKKNRFWGRDRSVELLFYPDVGIDEIGTNVNYLIEEKRWPAKKDTKGNIVSVNAVDIDYEGAFDDLVKKIEDTEHGARDLRLAVVDHWTDIENQCRVERKPRYQ